MKKFISLFIVGLMICFINCQVYAKSNITMEEILTYTKLSLESIRKDNLQVYTDVKVYDNSDKKMIEIECQYKGELLKTAIEYDENLNLSPGVHTLREAMQVEDCENHTNNAKLDNAIDILKAFNPINNSLFSQITGYTEKDINKYFNLNNGSLASDGYQKNEESEQDFLTINFSNFNLGRDTAAPVQKIIRNGNNIAISINAEEEDNTIVHVFRSTDDINYMEYKDIIITHNTGSTQLSEDDAGYYYKSVVEGSNEWSNPELVEKISQDIGNVDQTTSNPKTGALGISIAVITILLLLIASKIITKNSNIRKI